MIGEDPCTYRLFNAPTPLPPKARGVSILKATGLIENSTINSDGIAVLAHGQTNSFPTRLDINDSVITSLSQGGDMNLSEVNVSGSKVTATNADSVGLKMTSGTLNINNASLIQGEANGLYLTPERTVDGKPYKRDFLVNISQSQIKGVTGAAINVDDTAASVTVGDNSTLTAGNQNLIESINGADTTLLVDNSQLLGNIVTDDTSQSATTLQNNARLTGTFIGTNDVTINSGADWTMTEDATLNHLAMNGGQVNYNASSPRTLTVSSLSGNGTFLMNTDLAAHTGDLLNVTGEATGTHSLAITNTGVEPAQGGEDLQVVHTGSGDAQFSVPNGKVDAGTWQYSLIKEGTDWYLTQGATVTPDEPVTPDDPNTPVTPDIPARTTTPSTDAVLNMASAPVYIFNSELQNLRFRHGDVQSSNAAPGGVWARYLGSNNHISGAQNSAYHLNQSGMEIGGDTVLETAAGRLAVGAFVGYSDNNISHARGGSSSVDSTSGGLYATWMHNSGFYVDALAKYNHFSNDMEARMTDGTQAKGDYSQNGFGGSLETGMTFTPLADFWIQPYLRATAFRAEGETVQLDNGMKANISDTKSFQGEAGTSAGLNLDIANVPVKPYLKVAVVREFEDNNNVRINDTYDFRNDISGTTGKYGAGVSADLSQNASVWVEANYQKGDNIESPVTANAGFRINF